MVSFEMTVFNVEAVRLPDLTRARRREEFTKRLNADASNVER